VLIGLPEGVSGSSDTPLWKHGVVVLDDLQTDLDKAKEMGHPAFADADSLAVLQRLLAEFEALVTGAVACFDAGEQWADDGACNARAWLKAKVRLSGRRAASQVRRGRHLAHLPATAAAFAAGAITGDVVDVLIAADGPRTAEALRRDEERLVAQACSLRHDEFVRYMDYWRQHVDPDGCDADAEERRTRRGLHLNQSFAGMWFGSMTLDPVSGTIVDEELHRLEQLLFDQEWATARARLGREPTLADLAHTPAQRRADALVEMASRSKGATTAEGRRPVPLFTVLVGYETLHGRISQLENGTVMPPGSLLGWLGHADLERATFGPDGTRVAIGARAKLASVTAQALEQAVFTPQARRDIPPTNRLFTGATRRSIEVRDQTCCHPMCDVQASRCQVDHIQPWALGGPTTQENGRLLCAPHNRGRNQRPPPDG
jgi:hypothetical protein